MYARLISAGSCTRSQSKSSKAKLCCFERCTCGKQAIAMHMCAGQIDADHVTILRYVQLCLMHPSDRGICIHTLGEEPSSAMTEVEQIFSPSGGDRRTCSRMSYASAHMHYMHASVWHTENVLLVHAIYIPSMPLTGETGPVKVCRMRSYRGRHSMVMVIL